MTLQIRDQDASDSYSISISYRPMIDSWYDYSTGKYVYSYGDPIDITDLFIFDSETYALYYNGRLDFESKEGSLSGIAASHNWYDPITITITDASGSSDSMEVLMNTWDSSVDGFFDITYDGGWPNFGLLYFTA